MKYFVKASVLESVRKRYGIPLSNFADKIKVESSIITDWERNGAELSTSTMEKVADTISCHWSVLLRDEPLPPVNQPKNRRVSQRRNGYTPETKTLVSYREADRLLSHITQSNVPKLRDGLKKLILLTSKNLDFDKTASDFRVLVSYDEAIRYKLPDSRKVYDYLVRKLESYGIFISEQDFDTEDIRGFLTSKDDTYLIVISSQDKFPASRLFTLLHEVGHILMGKSSSACDLHETIKTNDPVENEERFCDSFAAAFLMPKKQFLEDKRIKDVSEDALNIDNDLLGKIAASYRTSYLAVVRRLYNLRIINYSQYSKKCDEFYKDIFPLIMAKRRKADGQIRLPKSYYVNKEIKKASRTFSEFVIDKYSSGNISSGEAKRLLGVDTRYLIEIEKAVGAGN